MTITRLPFDEVFADESGGNVKTPQSEYLRAGRFPVVDQGKALIAGYVDDEARICGGGKPAIVFGDHTRCVKYVDQPFCMGADGVKVLRPKIEAHLKYLYHYLRQLRLPDAGYDRHFKYLKRTKVVLLPLPEQRRIAAILDKADALCTKRREALAQLDRLAQSIFVEMFGDPMSPTSPWTPVPVSYFVAGFESGKSVAADDEEDATSQYRVLKVSAVTSLEFKPNESKAAPPDYVPQSSHFVRAGDLLFSRANTTELVGATAFVTQTPANLLLPDKLWRFVWHEQARAAPHFVNYLFRQPKFRAEIGRRASGSSGSMKNISQEKVMSIDVALPPMNLQETFVKRITKVMQMKAGQVPAQEYVNDLFSALQYRAFRGEL